MVLLSHKLTCSGFTQSDMMEHIAQSDWANE